MRTSSPRDPSRCFSTCFLMAGQRKTPAPPTINAATTPVPATHLTIVNVLPKAPSRDAPGRGEEPPAPGLCHLPCVAGAGPRPALRPTRASLSPRRTVRPRSPVRGTSAFWRPHDPGPVQRRRQRCWRECSAFAEPRDSGFRRQGRTPGRDEPRVRTPAEAGKRRRACRGKSNRRRPGRLPATEQDRRICPASPMRCRNPASPAMLGTSRGGISDRRVWRRFAVRAGA